MFCGLHLSAAKLPFSSCKHLSRSQESWSLASRGLAWPSATYGFLSLLKRGGVCPCSCFPVAPKQLLAQSLSTYGVRWWKPSSLNFPVRERPHGRIRGHFVICAGWGAQMLCCTGQFSMNHLPACPHMSGEHRDINREGSKELCFNCHIPEVLNPA